MSSPFPARQERLDWQLVAELEPTVLVLGAGEQVDKLQQLAPSLAFCSLETEFSKETLEGTRGLAKVTRLLQLSVQQLLHSHNTLSSQLTNVTTREEELQERLASLDTEVRTVRKEAKKRKKMLAAQQECMFKGTDFKEFQKCVLCPKTFINESFLVSHLHRRHRQEMEGNNLTGGVMRDWVQTTLGQHQVTGKEDTGQEVRGMLQEIRNQLATQSHNRNPDLASMVTTQQAQIQELQALLKDKIVSPSKGRVDQEETDGRLKAQEMFWKAKVKTMEDNFNEALRGSDSKLQKIQEEFETEVHKLKKQRRRDQRKQRRHQNNKTVDQVNIENLVENIVKSKTGLENLKNNNVIPAPMNNKEIAVEPKQDLKKENIIFVETSEKEEDIALVEEEILHTSNEDIPDKVELKVPTITNAFSVTSLKSEDHLYEAPISVHSSKESVFEMIENNPSKIDELRQNSKEKLADELQKIGVNPNASQLSKEQLNNCKKILKEQRKRLPNCSEHNLLRDQYEEEVETLALQSIVKHGSIKKRLSKGMSSFRRQIFRSLQNLRVESPSKAADQTISVRKRKSPKKKSAPQPPRMVQTTKVKSLENEYVQSPKRIPPKPAPRQSKIIAPPSPEPQSDQSEEEIDSSDEEDEEDEEMEQFDHDIIGMLVDKERREQNLNTYQVQEKERNDAEQEDDSITEDDDDNLSKDGDSEEHNVEKEVPQKADENDDDVTVVDDGSIWDSDDEDNDIVEEVINIDVHHDMEAEEIKLRRPEPGSRIADLTNIIETQLGRRSGLQKPAGGVDPLLAAMERIDENLRGDEEGHRSLTGSVSTNTLGTSQWQDNGSFHTRPGSAVSGATITVTNGQSSRPQSALRDPRLQPPSVPPRRGIASWDSD